jgi:starch synthase
MTCDKRKPRILFVSPEIAYLPTEMSTMFKSLCAREGELADFSAALVQALFVQGVDVHVALPDYRFLFNNHTDTIFQKKINLLRTRVSKSSIHLAEDRAFFYKNRIYSESYEENLTSSIAFQREVINTIVPHVQPDLIHCNDWMTGLIPAMARRLGIPCLFTIHNTYTLKTVLSRIEDKGIDAALFWQNLFYERLPADYEETREHNMVDFLASGIFAAHYVNTSSPGLLCKIVEDRHQMVDHSIQTQLLNKVKQGCALEISDRLDPSPLSETDTPIFPVQQTHTTMQYLKIATQYIQLYKKMLKRKFINQ